jgi:hypothetical protein
MATELDVYRDWLGITATERPLNHYQLLRLTTFEDDTAKIRERYRKMNAHVRKYGTGDYFALSQQLLNELAKAMLCLTDSQRKRDYDVSLGRRDAGSGRRRSLEDILLASQAVTPEQLAKARSFANAVGLEVRDALIQQKLAPADVVTQAYAESEGLPYLELDDIALNEQLLPAVPAALARQHSCVPVLVDGSQLLMASPNPLNPDVEEELRLRFSMPVRTVLCTPASINAAIAKFYGRGAATAGPLPAAAPAATSAVAAAAAAAVQAQAAIAPPPPPKPDALSAQEHRKRRLMVSMAGFAVTTFLYMFYQVFFTDGVVYSAATFGILFALAATVAVISYVVATVMNV